MPFVLLLLVRFLKKLGEKLSQSGHKCWTYARLRKMVCPYGHNIAEHYRDIYSLTFRMLSNHNVFQMHSAQITTIKKKLYFIVKTVTIVQFYIQTHETTSYRSRRWWSREREHIVLHFSQANETKQTTRKTKWTETQWHSTQTHTPSLKRICSKIEFITEIHELGNS